jgi:hypothetical protein
MKFTDIKGLLFCVLLASVSCSEPAKEGEQLSILEYRQHGETSAMDSLSASRFVSSPNTVLLTGMDRFRLVPVYKISPNSDRNIDFYRETSYNDNDYYTKNEGDYRYFMPGMDIIYGYNMINMGHYDVETERLTMMFDHPVLIRTFYFPGVKSDSLNHLPVTRNYFLVSVYDEDTNHDSLINTKDMRKFYHIDRFNSKKTQIIPPAYSAIRSTYDYKNDIMYIYARYDSNGNGTPEKEEPVAICWIRLNEPTTAKMILN